MSQLNTSPRALLPDDPGGGHLGPAVLLHRPQREAAGPLVVDPPRALLALPARLPSRVAEQDGAVSVSRGRYRSLGVRDDIKIYKNLTEVSNC